MISAVLAGYSLGTPPANISNFHLYNATVSSGAWAARMDGSLFASQVGNTVTFPSSANLGIGQYNTSAGDIAEVIVYDFMF